MAFPLTEIEISIMVRLESERIEMVMNYIQTIFKGIYAVTRLGVPRIFYYN